MTHAPYGSLATSLDPARRLAYSSAAMAGHILMIEDDERLAAMVIDYLGEVGFRVNHHSNAEDGLAALKRVRFDRLEIDRDAYVARIDGRERPLTSYQFALLLAMAKHAGRVMSRDALMDLMKGEPLEAFDRA